MSINKWRGVKVRIFLRKYDGNNDLDDPLLFLLVFVMILRTNKIVKLQKWMEDHMAQKKTKEVLEAKLKKVEAEIVATKEHLQKLKKTQAKLKSEIDSIECNELRTVIHDQGISIKEAIEKLQKPDK